MKLDDFDDFDEIESEEEEMDIVTQSEEDEEDEYDYVEAPKRRKKKGFGGVIAIIIVIIALAVLCVMAYSWVSKNLDKFLPGSTNAPVFTPGSAEIEGMVEDAYSEGYERGFTDASEEKERYYKNTILGGIRESLENGDSYVRSLRPYYPDQMLIVSGGTIKFVDIDKKLKMNNYTADNLKELKTGEFQYFDGLKKISHKGIDVSKHQGEIDWAAVKKEGVEFAIIRAAVRGYETGALLEDERFRENVEGALAQKIHVGIYVFSQAINEDEAIEEANMAINLVKDYKIDCPIVFDVEKVSASNGRMNKISVDERTQVTKAFCEKIKEAGYKPMIYFNLETAGCLINISELEDYDKWFAAYSTEFYYPYAYTVWQYASDGKIDGINGDVDLNISFEKIWF